MATRGRKPTPTAIKELEGNPGKRKLNENEPKPKKKAPSCPKWLEPEAKKEWRRLSKQMEQIVIFTEVDMASFAGYCQAYARWKEAEEFITQHGTIVKTPSGYWHQVPRKEGKSGKPPILMRLLKSRNSRLLKTFSTALAAVVVLGQPTA